MSLKRKKYMINLVNAKEKAFDKIPDLCMITQLTRNRKEFPNLMKIHIKNKMANISNCEIVDVFSLKSGR